MVCWRRSAWKKSWASNLTIYSTWLFTTVACEKDPFELDCYVTPPWKHFKSTTILSHTAHCIMFTEPLLATASSKTISECSHIPKEFFHHRDTLCISFISRWRDSATKELTLKKSLFFKKCLKLVWDLFPHVSSSVQR